MRLLQGQWIVGALILFYFVMLHFFYRAHDNLVIPHTENYEDEDSLD
jgi:hypothetical protein